MGAGFYFIDEESHSGPRCHSRRAKRGRESRATARSNGYHARILLGLHSGERAERHSVIGVTNDLARRVYEHKIKAVPSFTSRYDVSLLVWYEEYGDVNDAIAREKALKRWERKWKLRLIEENNPRWFDLYETLNQ